MKIQNWNGEQIPDFSGKTIIITGANSGIGFETAKALAAKNACVIMACRSTDKGRSAAQDIRGTIPDANLRIMALDLSDLGSIKNFSDRVKNKFRTLDLLINNAGVMIPPYGKTADGFELQMGTNHLGHFALTGRLLDLLKAAPRSRIVSVSSAAHKFGNIDFTDRLWMISEKLTGVVYP